MAVSQFGRRRVLWERRAHGHTYQARLQQKPQPGAGQDVEGADLRSNRYSRACPGRPTAGSSRLCVLISTGVGAAGCNPVESPRARHVPDGSIHVSSMATSIANASMLRSNNLPPSAHSPLTQSKRAVEALPSGWPPNTSKRRIHLRKTNNQTSRSYLAYLAFRSIFFRMKAPAGGLISLFSHKVHSFFGKLRGAAACEGRIQGVSGQAKLPRITKSGPPNSQKESKEKMDCS